MRRVRISFFRFFLLFVRFICRFLNRARVILRGDFYRFLNDRVCQITATNYESFSRYLSCTFFDRQRRITVLYSVICNLQDARRSHVRVTLDLLMYRRNEKEKKKGGRRKSRNTPSECLSFTPTGQHYIILSPSISLRFPFFSFSTVLLLSIKGSSGR